MNKYADHRCCGSIWRERISAVKIGAYTPIQKGIYLRIYSDVFPIEAAYFIKSSFYLSSWAGNWRIPVKIIASNNYKHRLSPHSVAGSQ